MGCFLNHSVYRLQPTTQGIRIATCSGPPKLSYVSSVACAGIGIVAPAPAMAAMLAASGARARGGATNAQLASWRTARSARATAASLAADLRPAIAAAPIRTWPPERLESLAT